MKHFTEEELIAYRQGEVFCQEELAVHLAGCNACRFELERIDAILKALDTLSVPDPGSDYGRHVWQQIAPRLAEKPSAWWHVWFEPRRLAAFGGLAALIVAAFFAGRITRRPGAGEPALNAGQVRQRVLVVAVGDHLGRSEMMLMELSNAEPANAKDQQVNISNEQRRAEDLLEENRLYRQTALQQGDAKLASVLDDLERVLLDVAHSPEELSPAQLEAIRQRIESQGILFKVRVVGKELQQRQEAPATAPAPAQINSGKKEGNKA
jgi:hypothetical protein